METPGRLARRFGLSRTALLYYDAIGLLSPTARAVNGYRQYSAADARRLEQICKYRRAGLALADIQRVLSAPDGTLRRTLEARLAALDTELGRLREQQRFILGVLRDQRTLERVGATRTRTWKRLFSRAGLSREDMQQWHVDFERLAPVEHERFLRFLLLSDQDVSRIRARARARAVALGRATGAAAKR